MTERRTLITGASGILGSQLKLLMPYAVTPSHLELSIGNRKTVEQYFNEEEPFDIVIHLAAMTKIPPCEEDPEKAWLVNVEGTKNVMESAFNRNSLVYCVYASTPCVFPGLYGVRYYEDSQTGPKNIYGMTKCAGEFVTRSVTPNHLIFRANFVARKKYQYPAAFTDRYGTYLFADQVAKAIVEIVEARERGTIHIVGDKVLSMYELAKRCPDSGDVKQLDSKDYNGADKLTLNMAMTSKKWHLYNIDEAA